MQCNAMQVAMISHAAGRAEADRIMEYIEDKRQALHHDAWILADMTSHLMS